MDAENIEREVLNGFIWRSEYAGSLIVNKELHISFMKKPNLFHRLMMKLFFGFEWEDAKVNK